MSDVEILSGGILKLHVAEAEVNDISIRFLDRKMWEPALSLMFIYMEFHFPFCVNLFWTHHDYILV